MGEIKNEAQITRICF